MGEHAFDEFPMCLLWNPQGNVRDGIEIIEVISLAMNEGRIKCGFLILKELLDRHFGDFCTALESVMIHPDIADHSNGEFYWLWKHFELDRSLPRLKLESPGTFELLLNSCGISQSSDGSLSISDHCRSSNGSLRMPDDSDSSDESPNIYDHSPIGSYASDWEEHDW